LGLLNTPPVELIRRCLRPCRALIGLARLVHELAGREACGRDVETMRIPLLVQLFFWYASFQRILRPARCDPGAAGVFMSNRGIVFRAIASCGVAHRIARAAGFQFAGALALTPVCA